MTPLFLKSAVFKTDVFHPHEPERQAGVFKLMSACGTLTFDDGYVWTVHLTVEIKLRFHISRRSEDGHYAQANTNPDTNLVSLAIHGKFVLTGHASCD